VHTNDVAGPPTPLVPPPWLIRLAEPDGADLDLVHRWMLAPHVSAFWHQAWTRDRWAEELRRQLSGDHSRPFLLVRDGITLAYLEVYRSVRDPVGACYPVRPDDLGVHVAIGDPAATGRGAGTVLLRAVADGLLAADPACTRVIAEPDIANQPSIRAFGHAGFRRVGKIAIGEKQAVLLVRARTEADLPAL